MFIRSAVLAEKLVEEIGTLNASNRKIGGKITILASILPRR
jgi:hypothetical protein